MAFLLTLLCWEGMLFLVAIALLVAGQLLSGGINTSGLLVGTKGDGGSYVSPERVQLLLFTLAVAFQYVAAVLKNPTVFPTIQEDWLALFGASHVVYLGGKLGALFVNRNSN
jgi:hypothetical protein